MKSISGIITYMGLGGPWTLTTEDGDTDAKAVILEALRPLIGQRATIRHSDRWTLVLNVDAQSEMHLDMLDNGSEWPWLIKRDGFGFSNVPYYITDQLCRHNKTRIEVRWDDTSLSIAFDVTQDVPRTQYCGNGNLALAEGDGRCVKGGPCAFLVCGGEGFRCAKFSESAEHILGRIHRGEMKATRIAQCVVDGRVP